jgi:hypothetical protein
VHTKLIYSANPINIMWLPNDIMCEQINC